MAHQCHHILQVVHAIRASLVSALVLSAGSEFDCITSFMFQSNA